MSFLFGACRLKARVEKLHNRVKQLGGEVSAPSSATDSDFANSTRMGKGNGDGTGVDDTDDNDDDGGGDNKAASVKKSQ